jgi:hypothetical protein
MNTYILHHSLYVDIFYLNNVAFFYACLKESRRSSTAELLVQIHQIFAGLRGQEFEPHRSKTIF